MYEHRVAKSRILAFAIWVGLVMLAAWAFILNGGDNSPNDTARNVLILIPVTLIGTRVITYGLERLAASSDRRVFWSVLAMIVVGIVVGYNGALTADSEKKERNFNKLKNQPGYTQPPRINFGQ